MSKAVESLWKKWMTSGDISLRDDLIVHYLFLVKWVVSRLIADLPTHIKVDDLYSSGMSGLIRAVEKYDPTKKSKFESYAILLIKGAIIDELRKLDWIPRSIHQKANWIAAGQVHLQQKLGREPTDSELSHHLEISEEEFSEILSKIRPIVLVPLNANLVDDEEGGSSLADRIPDQNSLKSSEIVHKKEFAHLLEKALNTLQPQERQVLVLYYYDDLMLKEIGKVLGVSESRVSQIHSKALLKLRGQLKDYQSFC